MEYNLTYPPIDSSTEKTLVDALETAVAEGAFTPVFQPIVHLRGGAISAFEVLARWEHATLGIVAPAVFIPLAERLGLIAPLTRTIIAKACAEAVHWDGAFRLALNISPLHFQDGAMPSLFENAVTDSGFPMDRTEIEITESAVFDDPGAARATLDMLRAKGVSLALDDFGTGFSSLSRLQSLPFDKLKIDGSFVRSMVENRENRKIVSAVIGLGQSLGMSVVAESVETAQQADMLIQLGCDLGQGWLFGRPVPAAQVPAMLRARGLKTGAPQRLDYSTNQRLAQLEAVYSGAPVALCFIDRQLHYLNANRRYADWVETPLEMILGNTLSEIVPWIAPQFQADMARALAGEPLSSREHHMPGSNRSGRSFLEAAHDENGEFIGISVAIVDITKLKRIASTVREEIDHHSGTAGVVRQFQWLADVHGRVYEHDPGAEAFIGLSNEQVSAGAWIEAVHLDDAAHVAQVWADGFRTGAPINIEFRGRRAEGVWGWWRVRVTPRFAADGKILHWHGLSEDISEQRERESTLLKLAGLVQGDPDGTSG